MDLERVVELHVVSDGSRGSGCLIGAHLILTAAHVVGEAGSTCRWRRLIFATNRGTAAPAPFVDAEVVWKSTERDAALIAPKGGGTFVNDLGVARLARPAMGEELIVDAAGFPRYAAREAHTDLVQLKAAMNAASGVRSGTLTLDVRGIAPTETRDWKGISGGPVFAGDALIAHLVYVPEGLGSGALVAIPVEQLVDDAVALALLRASGVVLPLPVVGAAQVAALPASGGWGPLRAQYMRAVLETYCALDRSGLPLTGPEDARPASAGFTALSLAATGPASGAAIGVRDVAHLTRVVITGQPGAGKSTALKQALTFAAERPGTVPVWFPLAELPDDGTLTAPRVVDALVEQARRQLLLEEVNAEFFRSALSDGVAAIAFDALDEAGGQARRQQVRDALAAFSQAWPACRIWLSSRPAAYSESPFAEPSGDPEPGDPPRWTRLDVRPLSAADMREFLRLAAGDDGTLAAAIAARDDLESLTHTPLTLTMLAGLAAREGLPPDAASVFQRWVHTMCASWEEAKGERASDEELARRLDALQLLGWAVQQRGEPAAPFTRQLARQALAGIFGGRQTAARDTLLDWLVRRSGLLAPVTIDSAAGAAPQVRFTHLQIQEYLAGAHVATLFADDPAGLMASMAGKWYRDDWREPLGFAVAQLASEGDLYHGLLRAVQALDEPHEDLLHRRTRLVAWLLSKVAHPEPELVATTVSQLAAIVDERGYRQLDACAALIGLARHAAARVPLAGLAAGTALAHAIFGSAEYPTPSDAHPWRLRAAEALARVEGPAAGLRHLDRVEADAPDLASTLRCLRRRSEWGDASTARARLVALFEGAEELGDRQAVDQVLRDLGDAATADALIDRMVTNGADLAGLTWACQRGRITPTDARVSAALSVAREAVRSHGTEFNASQRLSSDLGTALELAQLQHTPEVVALFDATLDQPGLVWYWATRVVEHFPELWTRAVAAMADFVLDATLTDRSRRSGVVFALSQSRDDDLTVPALLRLLRHEMTFRWEGQRIADALAARGRKQEALAVLREMLRHGQDVAGEDVNRQVVEVASRLDADAVYGWLDALYRPGPDPVADARQLESLWHKSGVGPVARGWFAHVLKQDKGREFLIAGTDNPRDTAFTDFARHALYGSVFYDDDIFGPDSPSSWELEQEFRSATGEYEAASALRQLADLGESERAFAIAQEWIAAVSPPTKESAELLAHRLERLSAIGFWQPEWRDLLADAIRLIDPEQRSYLLAALERRC